MTVIMHVLNRLSRIEVQARRPPPRLHAAAPGLGPLGQAEPFGGGRAGGSALASRVAVEVVARAGALVAP